MDRPTQPHSTPTPEDLARMWHDLGQTLAAANQHEDPRPEDERKPRVSAGPSFLLIFVVPAAVLIGALWPFGSWVAGGAW